ncbi:T9SS type A sorting domain-containing protein, partial [Flavobacterium sp. LBUM151]
ADNSFTFNQIVVGAFDPNDITCLEGKSVSPSTIGDYLHYIVNFENTGTAAAETVIVKIVVDQSKYDINSLQLMETSHATQTFIHGNVVEFVFPNINLGAPPTSNPTAKDPPVGSHGNILFKIKTADDLLTNDQVEKQADIFFDYNAPIETNKAETIFKSLGTKDFETDKSVALYPNPTKGNVTINCDNTIKKIELFDVQGRILQTKIENNNNAQLNISNKANGLYFIRITTENGVSVEKVIKE